MGGAWNSSDSEPEEIDFFSVLDEEDKETLKVDQVLEENRIKRKDKDIAVTRKGNILTKREVDSISKLKSDAKKRRKNKEKRVVKQRAIDKQKRKSTSSSLTTEEEAKQAEAYQTFIDNTSVEKPKFAPRTKVVKFSKSAKKAFRKARNNAKKVKKAAKKKRQQARKTNATTESMSIGSMAKGMLGAVLIEELSTICSFFPPRGSTTRKLLLSFAALIYSDSAVVDSYIFLELINHFDIDIDKDINAPLKHFVTNMLSQRRSVDNDVDEAPETESLSTTFKTMGGALRSLINSRIFTACKDLILSLVAWKVIPIKLWSRCKNIFGPPSKKLTFLDAGEIFLNSLGNLMEMCEQFAAGIPFASCFLGSDPIDMFFTRSQAVLAKQGNIVFGLPVENKHSARDVACELEPLVSDAKIFADKLNPTSVSYSKVLGVQENLKLFSANLRAMMSGQRPVPYGVVIHGTPGIGKSTVLKAVNTIFSDIMGRTFEDGHVYSKNGNYWDQYNGASQPIIHYSEMGSKSHDIVSRSGDPDLDEMCSIIDSVPYALNMASVEEKGKVFAIPEMVIIDTNVPFLGADKVVENPSAVLRRFVFIDVKLKKEFNKNGMIDREADCDDYFDKWNFTIYRMNPISNRNSHKVVLKEGVMSDLESFLREDVINHFEQQREHVSANYTCHFGGNCSEQKWEVEYDSESDVDEDLEEKEYDEDLEEKEYEEDIITESGDYFASVITFSMYLYLLALWRFCKNGFSLLGNLVKFLLSVPFLLLTYMFPKSRIVGIYSTSVLVFLFMVIYWKRYLLLPSMLCFSMYKDTEFAYKNLKHRTKEATFGFFEERWRKVKAASRELYGYCTNRVIIAAFVSGGAVSSMIYLAIRALRTYRMAIEVESSSFATETDATIRLNELEDSQLLGKSYKRVKVKGAQTWNTRLLPPDPLHTGDPLSLWKCASGNVRNVLISCNGEIVRRTCILGVKGSWAIIHRHAFANYFPRGSIQMNVCRIGHDDGHGGHMSQVKKSDLLHIKGDLCLIRLSSVYFKDITKHFSTEVVKPRRCGAVINGYSTYSSFVGTLEIDDQYLGELVEPDCYEYEWPYHKVGECGKPLIGALGKGAFILGIHTAGRNAYGYSVAITRNEIDAALKSHDAVFESSSISDFEYGGDPHPKSPVNYEDLSSINYYGATSLNAGINQKSKIKKTKFHDDIPSLFYEQFDFVSEANYQPPLMRPRGSGDSFVSPWNVGLRKLAGVKKALDRDVLTQVVDDAFLHFQSVLGEVELVPYDIETAINSVEEDMYLRRMDISKAAGYGTPGKKSKYLLDQGKEYLTYMPSDEITAEINRCLELLIDGKCIHPVYVASTKDETRPRAKVLSGSTRIFYASPLVALIIARSYLGPLYTLMLERGGDMYAAIGIDMHRDADELYHYIISKSDNIFEGDYGGFDCNMPFDIGYYANELVCKLLIHFGYTEEQMQVVNGILTDNLFPFVSFVGEMFMVPGLQPSGKYGTAEDNSLRGLILLMYAWYELRPNEESFFDNIAVRFYGDDVLGSVSPGCSDWFTTNAYAQFCSDQYGLEFTTASKEEVSRDFLSPSEMTFLKRNFVWHEDLQRFVAPLSLDSLMRTLMWHLPSGNMSEEDQVAMMVNSVLREFIFHCDNSSFDAVRSSIIELYVNCYHFDPGFPTYWELLESLDRTAMDISEEECPGSSRYCSVGITTESGDTEKFMIQKESEELHCPSDGIQRCTDYDTLIHELSSQLNEIQEEMDSLNDPYEGLSISDLRRLSILKLYNSDCEDVLHYQKLKSKRDATVKTILAYKRARALSDNYNLIRTESADVSEFQNVEDLGGDSKEEVDTMNDMFPIQAGQCNLLTMDDYISRPVEVASVLIPVDTSLNYSVEIWDALMREPSFRAKVKGYAYFRATLKVRINISASPFHFGRVLVSYQPFAAYNPNMQFHGPRLSLGGVPRQHALTYLSQSKESAIINIPDNKPLDMTIPFISPAPMMRLFNKSPLIIPDGQSFDDSASFGQLFIQTLNDVRSSASDSTDVSMFVYAWFEDMEYGTATGTVTQITTESADERETGPVEKVATAAATVASALGEVPWIAPLAKPSSWIFKGIAGVASWFGWSYPTMNNEPMRARIQAYQNGSNLIGYDTGKRIVLDPKQELTVDPRIAAYDYDDMTIAHMCSVESYLDTFSWDDSNVPFSGSLWIVPVMPTLGKRLFAGTLQNMYYSPTAMGYAAAPFEYWRGDITFRIEVVCSRYHRGKLAVYYEPNVAQSVVIDSELDVNKQYMRIFDIQETQDLTFTVEWAFPKAWARVHPPDLPFDLGTVSFAGDQLFDFANGYISFVPLTALQSPDGSAVEVNVYIKSDEMQFNKLSTENMPTQRPQTQSADINLPEEAMPFSLNESTATTDNISVVHFGENPVSFRALLKRFASDDPLDVPVFDTGTRGVFFLTQLYHHPYPTFEDATGTTTGRLTLFNYLRYAYLGMRGGRRFRYNIAGDYTPSAAGCTKVRIAEENAIEEQTLFVTTSDPETMSSDIIGTVDYVTSTNGGIEFEIPFYSNNMFVMAWSNDVIPLDSNFDQSFSRSFTVTVPMKNFDVADMQPQLSAASGEDFTFLRFNGAPPYAT